MMMVEPKEEKVVVDELEKETVVVVPTD